MADDTQGVRVEPVESGTTSRRLGAAIVWTRWLIPPAWIAAAAVCYLFLPGLSSLPSAGLNFLVPNHAAALQAARRSLHTFRVPLLPQVAVVQRNPKGLSLADQKHIAKLALRVDRTRVPALPRGTFALPISNAGGAFPGSRERGTTAITFLFFPASTSPTGQRDRARRYARALAVPGAPGLVTGSTPGRIEQAEAITGSVHEVSYAALGVILVVLGVYFRSFVAPLVTLASAGLSYLLAVRAVTFYARNIGSTVPNQVEPLIVVLLLGIVTDYSVFFLSGMRARLRAGERRVTAARRTTQQYLPIIFTAGMLVCLGVATLRVARLGFFQALGPAMAITVAVGVAVSVTWVPAVMGILGRFLFWPGIRGDPAAAAGEERVPRGRLGFVRRRWLATLVALVTTAALVAAASGLLGTRLGLNPIRGLTSAAEARRGANTAGKGFAPGILSPTEVDLRRRGLVGERTRLARLGVLLRHEPGVAGVIGAGAIPLAKGRGVFLAHGGSAARFLLVLDNDPFGAPAIRSLEGVEDDMPRLLRRAGLAGAGVQFTGATAVADDTVADIHHDLAVVALAAFFVNLVLLMLFLRSIVAPLYLVAASALAIGSAFGLTTYLFQGLAGDDQLTYFVPLSVGVLLVSFGSDYNVFLVGRIYQAASELPLRDAIATAAPRASRAITVAGVTLAFSFASLALIPLGAFREFAFAMAVGILLDTFVVRSFLIPAAMSAVGWGSWWPSHHGGRGRIAVHVPRRRSPPAPAGEEGRAENRGRTRV